MEQTSSDGKLMQSSAQLASVFEQHENQGTARQFDAGCAGNSSGDRLRHVLLNTLSSTARRQEITKEHSGAGKRPSFQSRRRERASPGVAGFAEVGVAMSVKNVAGDEVTEHVP